MAKYKKNEILKIDWVDTTTFMGWRSQNTVKKDKLSQCTSIGFFQKIDKNSITIAKCICVDGDNDVLDCQGIPHGCIKKIKRIRN